MSDRLTLANAIVDAGIERGKAERVASVIFDVIRDNVATKSDLAPLATEVELAETKAEIIKWMVGTIGIQTVVIARISGHSCRIGAAVDMLRYKESLPAIMASRRWKNPKMVARYTVKGAAKRIAD